LKVRSIENSLSRFPPALLTGCLDSKDNLPHYLFRAYSDESSGGNSPEGIISGAHLVGCGHESAHKIPSTEAKDMLERHFLWDYKHPSEFISWTSSLLFALQHAIRKAYFRHEPNVCICILNTRKLEQVSIYPATTLLKVYGIKDEGKLRHEYYNAEYLAHDRIEDANSFGVVQLDVLIDCELFTLFPELDDEAGKKGALYNRVKQLRSVFFTRPSSVTTSEVESLVDLGMCLGYEFALPMAVAFLSLRLRPQGDEDSLKETLEGLRDLRFPLDYVDENYSIGNPKFNVQGLDEVSQFVGLMQEISDERFKEHPQHSHEDALTQQLNELSCKYHRPLKEGKS
jgi:hypothetical protein